MSSLRDRLEAVRGRIARAAQRSGRFPSDVLLVAVSKTVPAEVMIEAARIGQTDFGENRVQEFRNKRPELDAAGIRARYHLVGHLQSNKARAAARLFDIIQSVDSLRIARLLDAEAGSAGKRPGVLLEVNYSDDPARPGFDPDEIEAAAADIAALPSLEILGLMTVAPLGLDEVGVRLVFRKLRRLRDRLAEHYPSVEWRHLSMGMTDDFEVAIEEGATIVRVGRAIFGERPA